MKLQTAEIQSGLPRWVDVAAALLLLVLLSPIIILCALLVRFSSEGPVFFVQRRIGRSGEPFSMYKFRSMTHNASGSGITAADDRRITAAGRLLRKTKLDELPELINIVKGDMAFVGPRPESPGYVELTDPRWRTVLQARPGLTDPVTIRLRSEETLMAGVTGDREEFYRTVLQPFKLKGYINYLQHRSSWGDVKILMKTVMSVIFPHLSRPPAPEELRVAENDGFQGGEP
ncbi:MAG TPA: sugar transferase [bacterium]|nr:sugar transferase [bacterium]